MGARTKILVWITALAAASSWSVPTGAQVGPTVGDQACDNPNNSISLFAENLGHGKIGYGRTRQTAKIPGPLIEMTEGDCYQINLVNDTNKRLSFHPHGVSYTQKSDGTPANKSCVAPGESRTYVIATHAPVARPDGTIDPGSAGYWHYHDHCMGTPHGTEGVARGLFGGLIVRRAGDPLPDKTFVLVMQGTTFNLKRAPRTVIKANLGQRVEFEVIGHGNLFHSFHLHAHRWADTRTGTIDNLTDPAAIIDNKAVGPADSFGFQIVAGEGVGTGPWMYHCHVQSHSDAGMVGMFMVRNADGSVSSKDRKTLRRWKKQEREHLGH